MKTIFITIFEGVEARNILRTDILPTLLSDPAVRLVLLMKNEERVRLYQKEFGDPRLIYEMVPYSRSLGRGLDRFFAWLKFVLLRTPSTVAFRGALSRFLSLLLAHPPVRKLARCLDFLLVRPKLYGNLFDKYSPDLVFLAHLFEEPEIHLLREAKRRGIKTISFINSWDKTTMRCAIRLFPDKFVVFNDFVKEELIKYHDAAPENIFVGGIPQFDHYFKKAATSRHNFFKSMGINPQKKLIVYAPVGAIFSVADWDWNMLDLLLRLAREGRFGEDAEVLVRFNPKDFVDETELKKRPQLLYDYPGKRLSLERGIDWDMNFGDIERLKETLSHMSLLICYASSISIEAALLDKPIININFGVVSDGQPAYDPTRFYKAEHYLNALRSGGIKVVPGEEELVKCVRNYLEDPLLDAAGRKRLVEEQCKFLDGNSGKRIGEFVLSYL